MLQIVRQIQLVGYHHDGPGAFLILERGALDQALNDGLFQVVVHVEQCIDAVLRRRIDVAKAGRKLPRLRNRTAYRVQIGVVLPAQPVRRGPDEKRLIAHVGHALEQGGQPGLFVRFHRHQRKARIDNDFEIALVVHRYAKTRSAIAAKKFNGKFGPELNTR